jgi:hypothetical protein
MYVDEVGKNDFTFVGEELGDSVGFAVETIGKVPETVCAAEGFNVVNSDGYKDDETLGAAEGHFVGNFVKIALGANEGLDGSDVGTILGTIDGIALGS